MKQNISILKLDWDTEFFGFKIGKVETDLNEEFDLENLVAAAKAMSFKLIYLSAASPLELETATNISLADSKYHIQLVDKKTTYEKLVSQSIMKNEAIFSYTDKLPNEALNQLAIASGVYSRFKIDNRIKNDKYEQLYRLWMTNSVNRKFAKEVFVYQFENEFAGMITLTEKDNMASIGLVAVNGLHRKKGIGKALVQAAEYWAYKNSYSKIQVLSQAANVPSNHLYTSLGYSLKSVDWFYHLWLDDV